MSICALGQFEERCFIGSIGSQANWERDKAQIRSIASCLVRYPTTVGYIGYYSNPKFSENKVTKRIYEAVADLKTQFPAKVFVKYLGENKDAGFYSRVLPENFPAPWECPTKYTGSPVAITFAPGWPNGNSYNEKERFVLSFPDDTLMANVIEAVVRELQKRKSELHHSIYLALMDPNQRIPLDPKKSIRDYKLSDGTILWIVSTVRC
jgi:hypothetical protein